MTLKKCQLFKFDGLKNCAGKTEAVGSSTWDVCGSLSIFLFTSRTNILIKDKKTSGFAPQATV